jgi:transposase
MGKILSSQEASDWREGRRLRAWELKQEGLKQQDIARALGVSKGAVSQWMKRAKLEGVEALKHKPPPGAEARLSEDERANLPELLARGAPAHGFRGEVWTCARVAEVQTSPLIVRYIAGVAMAENRGHEKREIPQVSVPRALNLRIFLPR